MPIAMRASRAALSCGEELELGTQPVAARYASPMVSEGKWGAGSDSRPVSEGPPLQCSRQNLNVNTQALM